MAEREGDITRHPDNGSLLEGPAAREYREDIAWARGAIKKGLPPEDDQRFVPATNLEALKTYSLS